VVSLGAPFSSAATLSPSAGQATHIEFKTHISLVQLDTERERAIGLNLLEPGDAVLGRLTVLPFYDFLLQMKGDTPLERPLRFD
jgi:hypothetical protein